MWSEAMRVCREYLPSQEAALRREIGQNNGQQLNPEASEAALLDEARRWLEVGEVRAALEILMRDPRASRAVLLQASEVLLQRAEPELAAQIGPELGLRLFNCGEHGFAAQVKFLFILF